MKVTICGARGSVPVSRPGFDRYGGETSCIAIGRGGRDVSLVLDAGTGIRLLSKMLARSFTGSILLSHLHLDHVQGLPFFEVGTRSDARVNLWVPTHDGHDPRALIDRLFSPPFFPIRIGELGGTWTLERLTAGEFVVEGFSIQAREIPHKGGPTYGFRISDANKSIAYLPDHAPQNPAGGLGELDAATRTLCTGADVLIHDSQHLAKGKSFLGHSAVEYAIGVAEACNVSRLLLFHHDPERTDAELDDLRASTPAWVDVAATGDVLYV